MYDEDGPTMGQMVLGGLAAATVVAAIAALGVGTSWFGLVTSRPMQAYAEDTRRLTFEHSKAHIDGTIAGVGDYCLNMREASDPASKKAVAHYIVNLVSTYTGPQPAETQACITEARGLL